MTSVPQVSDDERGKQILDVFNAAFGDLLARDPKAFQGKFRKMAATAFAFYRGSACLFYYDVQREQNGGPFVNDRTGRVWIHGDLHAENFGTYMDSQGRLIFNVNDFDEAYVGPFIWDVKRFAASIALIGYSKALSDQQITKLVRTYATNYAERIQALAGRRGNEDVPRFTLDSAKGPLLDALRSAREQTRFELLNGMTEVVDYDRRFTRDKGAIELEDGTRKKVLAAFDKYLETLPEPRPAHTTNYQVKDMVGRRGVGIGSAGLPSYNILLEGGSEALENDVVIYMKQAQTPALSVYITDPEIRNFFKHEGHRSVISQRALQAHADPWLGWAELDGVGQLVAEVSPYAIDLEWGDINDPEQLNAVVADLGKATATMHANGDEGTEQSGLVPFSVEEAINEAISADKDGFSKTLVDFAHGYGAQAHNDHRIFVNLFRNGQIPGL